VRSVKYISTLTIPVAICHQTEYALINL